MNRIILCCIYLIFQFDVKVISCQDFVSFSHSCNFGGTETESQYFQFKSSQEVLDIVDEIIKAAGVDRNSFTIKSSNVKNALATQDGSRKIILYSERFLTKIKNDYPRRSKWIIYGVFAHELGHHINGHDFSETDINRRKELELQADMFAGSILRNLGSSLENAKLLTDILPDTVFLEHYPSKRAREAAVYNGWISKDEILTRVEESIFSISAEKAREALFLQSPSEELILASLTDFPFSKHDQVTIREAKRILEWMNATNIRGKRYDETAEPYFSGILPTGYEVTIWVGTYQKKDVYGLRFGDADDRNGYFTNNNTYFELKRN